MPKFLMPLAVAVLLIAGEARAAEVKILVTTAMKAAIDELSPAFERASGHHLRISYGPSGSLARRIADGEGTDLVILAGGVDDLARQGKLALGARIDVARAKIGVAVRKGARKPDIGSSDAFMRALLAAESIAYADPLVGGASGVYLAEQFKRRGIADAVAAKAKLARGGPDGMVSALVANGEAQIGLQQIPEIKSVAGVDLVGALPEDWQTVTIYSAGIPVTATQADAASAFLEFLATPAARSVFTAKGLEAG